DPYALTYPGADKVDVLAADIYDNDYMNKYYDSLVSLAGGKPVAIGENGQMPSTAKLQLSQKNWVYMMSWGKMLHTDADTNCYTDADTNCYTNTGADSNTNTGADSNTDAGTNGYANTGTDSNTDADAGTPVLVRNDALLNFNWRQAAPDATLGVDAFSIRWTGQIKPTYSETYQFATTSDDGIRVYVDGTAVIDSWTKQSGTERTGSITLKAGQLYNIKVEYYENAGDANIRLMWQSPSQVKVTVPTTANANTSISTNSNTGADSNTNTGADSNTNTGANNSANT
ncbi:hypothetical protein KC345_g11806, partial [Hortaea werneckii]